MAEHEPGLARARKLEKTNQPQGRAGGATPKLTAGSGNPTKGGGINRATQKRFVR